MMHSDVKISGTNSGIYNILIAVSVFLVFLYVPLVQTVIDGKVVESFTVAENIDKGSGGFYLFLIFLMAAAILVIGILKITLSKIFQHFVVSVVDFYYSLGFCVGLILMVVALSSQNTGTSYWGHEIRQMMGIGPYLLIFCSLTYFVAALGHLCSFYKWYPLQTLCWGLHPVLNILVTSLLSLVAAKLIPDSAGDTVLKTVGVIISWGVLFAEIWLLVTYRKEWNRKLRARVDHNPENAETDSAASLVSIEKQQYSPQDVSPSAANAFNDKPQPVAPPVQKTVEVPASPGSRKKYYIIGGVSVLVVLSVLFFCLKGGETVEAVNMPAIKEALYEGKVGKSEVQMCLKQEGDSLYGTYFYKRNKQEIQLSGKIEDGLHYVVNEFVNGKNTGTFKMDYGEYDGEHFFTGKWTNGKKQVNVYLDEMESRILPSTDVEHPLVGEWQTGEDAKAFAHAQLGLYNRDIKGAYGIIKIMANDCLYTLYVDSIMKSEGCDAFVHTYEQNLTLHYLPSDKSLRIETEKWGTYNLYMDFRDLEKRLADRKALQQSLSEASESLSEAESSPEASEQLDIVENEIVDVTFIPVEVANEREEAEKARLQAELAAELPKEAEAEDPNKIYDNAEVMPEYPGGQVALMRYIAQNVKYPKSAQENGTQGKVVVQFVVDTDGSIINAYVLTSVDPDLDTEALRVIKSMPRWTPGKQKGKNVRVKYAVSVKFRLP
ncbi:energy transducer TonB [uncultured Bacteroides sp.]|uniref:energy transducer TonB n=1 Tax=uncultured Bacteroides sp. TaxID=162156 RepID=UPI002586C843|nr:energy transducer TonB [uncultured Bacteroides sp.]